MVRRIVDLYQPVAEIASGFGISARSAQKWLAPFRSEGAAGLQNC
jgi:transposase